MKAWISILKAMGRGGKATFNFGKSALGGVAKASLTPIQTAKNLGKGALTLGGGAFAAKAGWEAVVNDKSLAQTGVELVVGEETAGKVADTVEQIKDTAAGAVETVKDVTRQATSAVSEMGEAASGMGSMLSGLKGMVGDLFGGGGLGRIASFFDNICKGNVSGMSMFGLVAAGLLAFGRFGWLGKIAGLLMSLMIIGNNSQSQTRTQTQQQSAAQSRQPAQAGRTELAPQQTEQERPVVYRR